MPPRRPPAEHRPSVRGWSLPELPDAERGFALLAVISIVGTLAMLLWEAQLAPVFFVIAVVSYGLGRLAQRQRLRWERFEDWRTDPETAREWMREMGLSEAEIAETEAKARRMRGE